MAYIKKTGTSRKKAASTSRISNIVKPRGMSLQGWQIALRRQAAQKENFGIVEVDTSQYPGEYVCSSEPCYPGKIPGALPRRWA